MKHYLTLSVLLALLVFAGNMRGQNNIDAKINEKNTNKGAFFITPFYEFTSFKNLELASHAISGTTAEGFRSVEFSDRHINEYNEYFNTEYSNSAFGVKLGYCFLNGIDLGGYVGVNHFKFESWKSSENSDIYSTGSPTLSLGLTADYKKALSQKLSAIASVSYNYSEANSLMVDNSSGEEIISSSFKSMYWKTNLALAYSYKKLTPYVGLGFTQQYINSIMTERIITTDENDIYIDVDIESDAHYKGNAFHAIAGAEYQLNSNSSIFISSTFINLIRANIGFRIFI